MFNFFELDGFANKNNNEEKKQTEQFMSGGGIAGLVIMSVLIAILLIAGIVYFTKFRKSASAIKYLTSSTSPNFDLTFTPNL